MCSLIGWRVGYCQACCSSVSHWRVFPQDFHKLRWWGLWSPSNSKCFCERCDSPFYQGVRVLGQTLLDVVPRLQSGLRFTKRNQFLVRWSSNPCFLVCHVVLRNLSKQLEDQWVMNARKTRKTILEVSKAKCDQYKVAKRASGCLPLHTSESLPDHDGAVLRASDVP